MESVEVFEPHSSSCALVLELNPSPVHSVISAQQGMMEPRLLHRSGVVMGWDCSWRGMWADENRP